MGATNDIKETNITLKLVGLTCPECEEKFTQQEIKDDNYNLWFDTTNDVKLEPITDSTIESIVIMLQLIARVITSRFEFAVLNIKTVIP